MSFKKARIALAPIFVISLLTINSNAGPISELAEIIAKGCAKGACLSARGGGKVAMAKAHRLIKSNVADSAMIDVNKYFKKEGFDGLAQTRGENDNQIFATFELGGLKKVDYNEGTVNYSLSFDKRISNRGNRIDDRFGGMGDFTGIGYSISEILGREIPDHSFALNRVEVSVDLSKILPKASMDASLKKTGSTGVKELERMAKLAETSFDDAEKIRKGLKVEVELAHGSAFKKEKGDEVSGIEDIFEESPEFLRYTSDPPDEAVESLSRGLFVQWRSASLQKMMDEFFDGNITEENFLKILMFAAKSNQKEKVFDESLSFIYDLAKVTNARTGGELPVRHLLDAVKEIDQFFPHTFDNASQINWNIENLIEAGDSIKFFSDPGAYKAFVEVATGGESSKFLAKLKEGTGVLLKKVEEAFQPNIPEERFEELTGFKVSDIANPEKWEDMFARNLLKQVIFHSDVLERTPNQIAEVFWNIINRSERLHLLDDPEIVEALGGEGSEIYKALLKAIEY